MFVDYQFDCAQRHTDHGIAVIGTRVFRTASPGSPHTSSMTRTWKAGKAMDKVMKIKHKKKEKEKAPTAGPSGTIHRMIRRLKLKTSSVTTGPSGRQVPD